MAGGSATGVGGSASQQAVSWNVLAYLLTLSFLLLQQLGTLYYLGLYSLPMLVMVCYDVVVLLLFLSNNSAEYAALKGGTCWVVYVWGLTVKLLLFFFVVFSSKASYKEGSNNGGISAAGAAYSTKYLLSAKGRGGEAAAARAQSGNGGSPSIFSVSSNSSNSTEEDHHGEFMVPGFLFQHPRGSVVEVALLLLVAGSAVYALLVFRALEQLVGGVAAQLSTEGMLLTDCVAHVVLDFIDAGAAFYTYSTCPAAINEQTTWLRVIVGIVLALAVFLHGYSFPSPGGPRMPALLLQQPQQFFGYAAAAGAGGGGAAAGQGEGGGGGGLGPGAAGLSSASAASSSAADAQQQQQRSRVDASGGVGGLAAAAAAGGGGGGGDIFMTRKHAALVGICIVDVPLACLRLFTWAHYPTYEGFSPFLFKNICFLPIQCARIRHASLAARLKAKRQQKLELLSLMAAQEAFRASASMAAAKQQQQMQSVAAAAAAAAASSSAAAAPAGQQPPPAVVVGISAALDAAAPSLPTDAGGWKGGAAAADRVPGALELEGGGEEEAAAGRMKGQQKGGGRLRQLLQRCCCGCLRFFCCCGCASCAAAAAKKKWQAARQQQQRQAEERKRRKRRRERERQQLRRYRAAAAAAAEDEEEADETDNEEEEEEDFSDAAATATEEEEEEEQEEEKTDDAVDAEERALMRLVEVCRTACSKVRRLPVAGFSFKRVLQRIYFSKLGGGRHGVASLLDGALRVSFWKEIRLAVPFMATWVCQIAIVSILFYFYREVGRFPVQLFSLQAMTARLWLWENLPVEMIICLTIISGHFVVMLCCWILAAPLLDVCCVAVFASLRLLSFFLLVLSFRDFGVFSTLFNLQTRVDNVDKYALFLFAVEPMVGVLYTLYPVLCVMLGRGYISYVVQPAKTSSSTRGTPPVFGGAAAATADGDFTQMEAQPRGDEAGVVSTVSLMVFLNCRYMLAPLSIHQLLIGANMIKAVRLNDGLLRVHWRQLLVVLVLRCWCFLLFVKFPQSITYGHFPIKISSILNQVYETPELQWYERFSFASIIFLAHIALMLLYMITSQVTRLLALRRIENKAIFRDVALVYTQMREEKMNTLTLAIAAGGDRVNLETVALQQQPRRTPQREAEDIVQKYYIHCSQTWPGDFLPNFF